MVFGLTYQQKAAATAPGVNYLVSADSSGSDENHAMVGTGTTTPHNISGDGRYVVFTSAASNLVPNDTNGVDDVFVKDTQTGVVTTASVSTAGVPSDGTSTQPEMSYDGRYVVFVSTADNIVSGVSGQHIYRRDLVNGTTAVVDETALGTIGSSGLSGSPDISADGRYVVFSTTSSNLSGSALSQIVEKDMSTGALQVVSKTASGTLGNGAEASPTVSCDGSVVAFLSKATNLTTSYSGYFDLDIAQVTWDGLEVTDATPSVNSDGVSEATLSCNGEVAAYTSNATNIVSPSTPYNQNNVYVYNRISGGTTFVAVDSSGNRANGRSANPSLSDDGSLVAFWSIATNLDTTVPNPYNKSAGIYVRDLRNSTTELATITALGNFGQAGSAAVALSADGSYVSYDSVTPDSSNSAQSLISGLTVGASGGQDDIYESQTGF